MPPPSSNARNRPGETTGRTVNWLKRETPFLSDIRFKNDLPEVPCEPKMLVSAMNPKALAAFHLTSLEAGGRRELAVEADLGAPLTVLDVSAYAVPAAAQPLHPDDEALLEGEGQLGAEVPMHQRARSKMAGDKGELSWLMRTTYISNDMTAPTPAKGRTAVTEEEGPEDQYQRQIQHIQETFESAKRLPVHQTNPSLHPVEVLPVLPDEEAWENDYVQLVFDGEPTADISLLRSLPPRQRRAFAEQMLTKSYKMTVDGANVGFLALLVPTAVPNPEISPSEREDTEMQWVREYVYDVKQHESDRDFVFRFPPPPADLQDGSGPTSSPGEGVVRYVAMDHKLLARSMGGRQQVEKLAATFSKPSEITAGWRPYTEVEEDARAAKRQQLLPGHDDENLFDDEDDGGDDGGEGPLGDYPPSEQPPPQEDAGDDSEDD